MAKETVIVTAPMTAVEMQRRFHDALNAVRAVFALEPGSWGEPTLATRTVERPHGLVSVETETRRCGPFSLERTTARNPDGSLYSAEAKLSMMEAPFIRFYLYGNEEPEQPIVAATFHEGYLREEQTEALLNLFAKAVLGAGARSRSTSQPKSVP